MPGILFAGMVQEQEKVDERQSARKGPASAKACRLTVISCQLKLRSRREVWKELTSAHSLKCAVSSTASCEAAAVHAASTRGRNESNSWKNGSRSCCENLKASMS